MRISVDVKLKMGDAPSGRYAKQSVMQSADDVKFSCRFIPADGDTQPISIVADFGSLARFTEMQTTTQ